MSQKHLGVLTVVLLVTVAAILLLAPSQTSDQPDALVAGFLDGLKQGVNDIDHLTVATASQGVVVTLRREESSWQVDELNGYPAELATVREVLAGLAEASIIEPKTSNPDYYERLGVEDIGPASVEGSQGAGKGVRLDLSAGDTADWSIIIGNSASNRGGHYVRETGTEQSLLVSFTATVSTEPAQWANTTIIDLAAPDVAEVAIEHADGEQLSISKLSADETDFVVHDMPADRELESSWSVNSLGSIFATLDMEFVQPEDSIDWRDPTRISVVTFSGLNVTAELLRQDSESWLRLTADAPYGSDTEVTGGDEPTTDTELESAEAKAAAINERVRGWAYRIPEYKAITIDKRLQDLLKQTEAAAQGES